MEHASPIDATGSRPQAQQARGHTPWTVADIPDLSGKLVLITGANSGLGLESARALSDKGAHVIMACRSPHNGEQAMHEIRRGHARGKLEVGTLDLANLRSVRAFAAEVAQRHARLDVLINNAGIMATPYTKTADGFELQFGTNHLGHFALTGLLFGLLTATREARVVTVSSQAHTLSPMRFEDLGWERGYQRWPAYAMSKLANLLFTYELARRIEARGLGVLSVAAHPGYSGTNLQLRSAAFGGKLVEALVRRVNPLISQTPAMGALPQLYAATADDVRPGEYIGPDGFRNLYGYPAKGRSNRRSRDPEAMRRLWEVSTELTGVQYPGL